LATIRQSKKIPPVAIKKFLGLNENGEGQFNLKLGEASKMLNFRITPQGQLKKREGWKKIFDSLTGNVQGMWYGKLNNTTFFLFCNNGHLYSGNLNDGTKTDLGTLTDAPTRFIPFGGKVYLNNGTEYKSYDGTTFATVTGYRPKIAIGTPPAGGGTLYEQINVLTGAKHQTFSADGIATEYQLLETSIASVDFVYVNGVLKTVTTDYTVNLTTGKITFVVAPAIGQDNVDIGWTNGTGQRSLIEKCRFSMDYSGKTDSRVFLWGNTDHKNRRFWSGLADGVPSAEYFEANSYSDEGNGQYAITDIVKQYDTQKIFLENGARYSIYEAVTIEGQTTASFPSYELNEEVGNVSYGQVRIVNNNPLTIDKGIRAWKSSSVREQFNQELISQRVQDSLDTVDLTTAVTVDYQENKEYWLCIGNVVWIYNYLNDTWYKFDNINAKCFIVVNGDLYFGANGYIAKFDITERTDEGTAINAVWEMGFYDFEADYLTKYLNNIWVAINPYTKTSVDIQIATNNEGTSEKQTVYYSLSTFLHCNFEHFSFSTSYNPQPKFLELQAYGFVYMKLILTNNSETDLVTVLSINLPARYGGKVR
jgi:hypothetical protein